MPKTRRTGDLRLCPLVNDRKKFAFAETLSRITLTAEQATRWWDSGPRRRELGVHITDDEIIDNPYRLSEHDRAKIGASPVVFATVDRSMVGEASGAKSTDTAVNDPHRLRAAVVAVLRDAENDGDTLLPLDEIRGLAGELPVPTPVTIGPNWIPAHIDDLANIINVDDSTGYAQLTTRAGVAEKLRTKLSARSRKALAPIDENWRALLIESIRAKGDDLDKLVEERPERVEAALADQERALERIVSRKLTVLVGRAVDIAREVRVVARSGGGGLLPPRSLASG